MPRLFNEKTGLFEDLTQEQYEIDFDRLEIEELREKKVKELNDFTRRTISEGIAHDIEKHIMTGAVIPQDAVDYRNNCLGMHYTLLAQLQYEEDYEVLVALPTSYLVPNR